MWTGSLGEDGIDVSPERKGFLHLVLVLAPDIWPVNDDVVDLQEVGSLGDEKDELGGVQHNELAVGDGDWHLTCLCPRQGSSNPKFDVTQTMISVWARDDTDVIGRTDTALFPGFALLNPNDIEAFGLKLVSKCLVAPNDVAQFRDRSGVERCNLQRELELVRSMV